MKQRFLLTLIMAVCMAVTAFSQGAPQGFNYQSIVRNTNGDPIVNQSVSLLFAIRTGSVMGPIAYYEKHTTATNDFGLVNLVIGQGTPLQGTFSTLDWAASSMYLTVSIESSPNVFDELGSSQLLSVPYALFAQSSGNSSNGDNWGSQTAFTNSSMTGNGLAGNPLGLAQQNAQQGQVLKWNGSSWAPADDIIGMGSSGGTVTEVNTGAGLTGGPITVSGTIGLSNTGVAPGTYGSATEIPVITVDAQGRVSNIFKTIVQPGAVGLNSGTGISVITNGFNNFTVVNTGDTDASDDLTNTTQFGGDVSGTANNLQINPSAIINADMAPNSIGSPNIIDGAVSGVKISQMNAQNGQVLKWNGAAWAPALDETGMVTLNGGTGITISGTSPNYTITNSGDTNPNDDITTSSIADGDITGPFNALQIKPNVVTGVEIVDNAISSSKIQDGAVGTTEIANGAVNTVDLADGSVTAAKLSDMNASNGEILRWDGNFWVPSIDQVGSFSVLPGIGIDVSVSGNTFVINNAGDTDALDDVTNTTLFGGDVSGTASNLQINTGAVINADMAANSISTPNLQDGSVTGAKLNQMNALNGQVLKWNGTNWAPGNDVGGGNGDNWGTQVAATGNAISGNGTVGSPLNIAQQGAGNGQVLKWNGGSWTPGNDNDSGGDDWGTQSVVANATLEGNGTAGTPLKLAQQGAVNGQILKWNGGAWAPADDAGGDDWGGQVTQTSARLTGDGTAGSPLDIAEQGAFVGQVLKWNGTNWAPDNDLTGSGTGDSYFAGTGISITGASPMFTINNIGDNDNDASNEIQVLSLAGPDTLKLSKGGGMVILPSGGGGNDYMAGPGISITGTAPNLTINNTGDSDADPLNEIQVLSLVGPDTLSLSKNGGKVKLPAQNTYSAGTGISITGSAPNFTINNTGDVDKDTLNEIQMLDLTGTVLSLNKNGGDIDLGPLLGAGGNFWMLNGDDIFNVNTESVLIGTNSSVSGKLQVVNADPMHEAGHFTQTGGTKAAIFAEAKAGAAAYFTSETGPALLTGDGKVGIGNVIPQAIVHVNGDGESMRIQGASPIITFVSTATPGIPGVGGFIRQGAPNLVIGSNGANQSIQIKPNGMDAINAEGVNGNVGIGSAAVPTGKLHVFHDKAGLIVENTNSGANWEFCKPRKRFAGALQQFPG